MVIAIGSYPIGRRFESHRRYHVGTRQRVQEVSCGCRFLLFPKEFCTANYFRELRGGKILRLILPKSFCRLFGAGMAYILRPYGQIGNYRNCGFYISRPHGQAVKTSPFHGGNPGSSPGGVTKRKRKGKNLSASVFVMAEDLSGPRGARAVRARRALRHSRKPPVESDELSN